MNPPPLLYLSASNVRLALPMPEAIAAMREAFVQLADGQATVPARMRLDFTEERGVALFMPAHSARAKKLGLKLVTLFEQNRALGLPLINALVLLFDATNGLPLAILEGASLTALRTGAASGAATDALARPDATLVAIFGAGVQARTQLEAVCAVRPIRQARVHDVNPEAAARFAREMSEYLRIPVEPAATPASALAGAQIICTATTSREPVFSDRDLSPGAHINAIGSYKPEVTELPAATVARAHVVVDQRSAAAEEAGDLLGPLRQGLIDQAHFSTELGAVLAGRAAGRRSADEITLFKSVGVAIQDLYAASRALENAIRLKLGVHLPR